MPDDKNSEEDIVVAIKQVVSKTPCNLTSIMKYLQQIDCREQKSYELHKIFCTAWVRALYK